MRDAGDDGDGIRVPRHAMSRRAESLLLLASSLSAYHVAVQPPSDGFVLVHPHQKTNFSTLFVPDDCPMTRDVRVVVRVGDREHSSRLFERLPLRCSVRVFLARQDVDIERPYVDVVAILDVAVAKHSKQIICIRAKLSSTSSSTDAQRCDLKGGEKEVCSIRIAVPFSWFTAGDDSAVAWYAISEDCEEPAVFDGHSKVLLTGGLPTPQFQPLAAHPLLNVSLVSQQNLTFSENSLHSMFIYFNATTSPQLVEIRLWIDSRLSIENVYPASAAWTVRVTSALRPLFYTSLACTPSANATSWDGRVVALLVRMTTSTVLRDDVVLHWHVRLLSASESLQDTPPESQSHKVATKFGVAPDETASVVLVPKKPELINTAVISGEQVATQMRVFAVSHAGAVRDVTLESHCISGQTNVIKTSPTCTTAFVDGTEVNGSTSVHVYVHYYRWTSSFSFRVWYPKLPVTVWISGPVLHPVSGWRSAVWKELRTRTRRAARQFSCVQRIQQKQVKVLATMWVVDAQNNQVHFLSTHRQILFDVTSISIHSLHVSNQTVASLRFFDGRALLSGENLGSAKIILRRGTGAQELGSEDFVVSADAVDVAGLSSRPACDVAVDVSLVTASFFNVSVRVDTAIKKIYQHCWLQSTISYSDGSVERVEDVEPNSVIVSSVTNDKALAVASSNTKNIELIAIDEKSTTSLIDVSLAGSEECAQPTPTPFAHSVATVALKFAFVPTQEPIPATTATSMSSEFSVNNVLLVISLVILAFIVLYRLFQKYKGFKGYEQLVAPLLSRLSSTSSSAGRDEDTNEWVWLSSGDPTRSTLGSAYSSEDGEYGQRKNRISSTSQSYDENTKSSVSYRGSEISVFISPNPVVSVNSAHDRTSNGRCRFARHALVDSTSDHNLARVVARGPSHLFRPNWPSDSDDAWTDHHTWTWRKRQDAMTRESVA